MHSTNPPRWTRRTFLKSVGYGGAVLPLLSPRLVRAVPASGKLNLAAIGAGGKGWDDLNDASGEGELHHIVALCDIDHRSGGEQPDNLGAGQAARALGIGRAAERYPDARTFADFRKLFDEMANDVDALTISTPDHMHATVAIPAMQLGKHVYVQKPLTQTVHESRVIRQQAERHGVVTQMGNQEHSSIGYRCVVEAVRAGAIGRIVEAHAWTPSPSWPQAIDRPTAEDAVPAAIHWDLWLGVAEPRPYVTHAYHNFNWRGWQEFGTGALGDMGCHVMDPVVWSLELGPPKSVVADNEPVNAETYPLGSTVRYEFAGTAHTANDTVAVTWYENGRQPPIELAQMGEGRALPRNGALFIGEEGTLLVSHAPTIPRLYPEEKFHDYMQQTLRPMYESFESQNHYRMWTDAILEGRQANAHFGYAGPLNETVMVGTIAQRLPGRRLEWDAEALRFANDDEASRLVRRSYRSEYAIPELAE